MQIQSPAKAVKGKKKTVPVQMENSIRGGGRVGGHQTVTRFLSSNIYLYLRWRGIFIDEAEGVREQGRRILSPSEEKEVRLDEEL